MKRGFLLSAGKSESKVPRKASETCETAVVSQAVVSESRTSTCHMSCCEPRLSGAESTVVDDSMQMTMDGKIVRDSNQFNVSYVDLGGNATMSHVQPNAPGGCFDIKDCGRHCAHVRM